MQAIKNLVLFSIVVSNTKKKLQKINKILITKYRKKIGKHLKVNKRKP